jgi:hypothetical protein
MKGTEAEACELSMQACIPKVTRLVVVPEEGPTFEVWNTELKFSLQDECQTLKIFTAKKPKRRSEITKDLHTPKYRQRVIPPKKGKKPKGISMEEMLDGAMDTMDELKNDESNG